MLQHAHGLMGMPSRLVHQQLTAQDFVNILVQEPKFIKLRHAVPPKTMHMYQIHEQTHRFHICIFKLAANLLNMSRVPGQNKNGCFCQQTFLDFQIITS